jgi:single-stranded DNA-binding protein
MSNLYIGTGNVVRDAETKSFTKDGKERSYIQVTFVDNPGREQPGMFVEAQFWDAYDKEKAAGLKKGERVTITGSLTWEKGRTGDKLFYKIRNASFLPGHAPFKKDADSSVKHDPNNRDESADADIDEDLPF